MIYNPKYEHVTFRSAGTGRYTKIPSRWCWAAGGCFWDRWVQPGAWSHGFLKGLRWWMAWSFKTRIRMRGFFIRPGKGCNGLAMQPNSHSSRSTLSGKNIQATLHVSSSWVIIVVSCLLLQLAATRLFSVDFLEGLHVWMPSSGQHHGRLTAFLARLIWFACEPDVFFFSSQRPHGSQEQKKHARLRFRCDYHLNRQGEIAQAGPVCVWWRAGTGTSNFQHHAKSGDLCSLHFWDGNFLDTPCGFFYC